MAVGRISGPLLKSNLLRDGVDLAFETDLLYLDVNNGRIGIKNAAPGYELDITGTTQTTVLRTGQAIIDNIDIDSNTISATVGDLNIDPATATDRVNIGPAVIPNIYGNVFVDGQITATGDIIANGDIVLGNADTDSVQFIADVDSNIVPNIDDTYTLGTGAQRWLEGHFADLFVDGVAINTGNGNSVSLLSDEINKIYVHLGGDDVAGNGENVSTAYRTVKHALSQATAGDTIVVSAGVFEEEFPLAVPEGVSVVGSGIRATTIKPSVATNTNDGFYLSGDSTVQNLSIMDMFYDGTADTGYAFQFDNGTTITRRSPYVKEVSVLNRGSVTTAQDPFGFAAGDAGRGIRVDGERLTAGSLEPAMLFDSITLIVPNSVGLELTNGARVEWLNSFIYFADIGIDAYEGTLGKYGNGKTYIELAGIAGTIAAGDTATFNSTDLSTVITVTVESVDGNTIVLDGRIDDFEGFDFTPQSITFAPSGATATSIVRYDRKEFGAEMRSIASANVYGNRGIRANGADVRLRMSSHDFGYIGSGGDFSNNDNLVNTANEIIELNEGRVFYNSTDQYGDYRIGDLFLVDQDTGAVTFSGGQFDVTNLTGITFTDGSNTTIVDPTKVETGNLKLSGNTLESLVNGITIRAINNEVTIDSNTTVTGQGTFASVNVEDLTDNRIVIVGTDGELEDDANFTFDGTTLNVGATGEFIVDVATGNTQVKGTIDVDGQATLASANVEDLTTDRIVVVGTNGELEDDANFTWDGSTLAVTGDQTLSGTLDVDSQATVASLNVEDLTSGRVVLAGTDGEIEDSADLTFDGTLLAVTGNTSITGTLDVDTSATVATLNVEDLTTGRIVLSGNLGELEDSANLTFNGTLLTVTGNTTVTGTLEVDTDATIATLQVEDLTNDRIVISGVNGELEDDSNFVFDGTTFKVGTDVTDKFTVDVATGNTTIAGTIDIDGQVTVASLNVEDLTSGRVLVAGINGEIQDDSNFVFDGSTLTLTGDATVTGTLDVDTDAIIATLKVEDLTSGRVVLAGADGEIEDSADLTFISNVLAVTGNQTLSGTLDVEGQSTLASVNVEDLTATRVVFAGTNGELEDSASLTFNGTDLIVSSVQVQDLTENRITIAGAFGALEDDANFTFDGSTFNVGATGEFTVDVASGNTQIKGTLDVDSQGTIASLNVQDLTQNRVVYAGANGELVDNANLTYDGTTLTLTGVADLDNIRIDGNTISSTTGGITIDPSPTGVAGTLTVAGDLVVQGTTTTIESTVTTIEDPVITLGGDDPLIIDDGKDKGIEFQWHTGAQARLGFFGFDRSQQAFTFITDASNTSEVFTGLPSKIVVGDVENTSLTQGRLTFAGVSGLLVDDANLTWDGSTLDVNGNLDIDGDVTLGSVNTQTITLNGEIINSIIPNITTTYNLGSPTKEWSNVYATAIVVDEFNNGQIKISSNVIENTVTDEGIIIRPNGSGTIELDGVSAVKLPGGNEADRPSTPEPGQVRYNAESARVENYNGEAWNTMTNEDDAIAFSIALG